MFFKRKTNETVSEMPELPWDDRTVERFARYRAFDARITSATKRSAFGSTKMVFCDWKN